MKAIEGIIIDPERDIFEDTANALGVTRKEAKYKIFRELYGYSSIIEGRIEGD